MRIDDNEFNRTAAEMGMPPGIIAALDTIITMMARELGESPEAWRGATEIATGIASILTGLPDVDDVEANKRTLMMLLAFVTKFAMHPLATPPPPDTSDG